MSFLIRFLGCVLLAAVLTPVDGAGQNRIDRLRTLPIDSLIQPVQSFYSPGGEERAAEFADLLARFDEVVADSLGVSLRPVMAVLNEEHWDTASEMPFGVPGVHRNSQGHFVLMPTMPAPIITESFLEAEPYLSTERNDQLESAGWAYRSAAFRLADLLLFHELGHSYALELGITTHPRWFAEFIATYIGYGTLGVVLPDEVVVWDAMLDGLAAAPPRGRTLENFDEFVGSQEVMWYQGHFAAFAREVLSRRGFAFVREVVEIYEEHDVTESADLLSELERVAPGFQEWSRSVGTN